jgi:hypothetical protein
MRCKKSKAAFIGPMVCELEGPGPTLNKSKIEVIMGCVFMFDEKC